MNDESIDEPMDEALGGSPDAPPAPRLSESLLMRALSEESFENKAMPQQVYCGSQGRAQLAAALAVRWPTAHVTCNFLDLYQADQSRQQNGGIVNLTILCQADLPDETGTPFDLVAFPFQSAGDAELTRELMQAGHERLREGGQMWVSTDSPRDHWLNDEFRKLFSKVNTRRYPEGLVYSATKTGPLKKRKHFECEFAFRDGERLLRVVSRPGVLVTGILTWAREH